MHPDASFGYPGDRTSRSDASSCSPRSPLPDSPVRDGVRCQYQSMDSSSPPSRPSRFTGGAARDLLDDSITRSPLDDIPVPHDSVVRLFPEVQNALWAAQGSTDTALFLANVTNRLMKTADGKSLKGSWTDPAVDLLRSALLFASAGLDTSLKRLVKHALPLLVDVDESVEKQFQKWAADQISGGADGGGINPKALVRVLMSKGVTPRASLMEAWVYELTDGSAQSVDRVDALCSALGVTDKAVRARTSPKAANSVLKAAFVARNQIAHELDVTDPSADTRQRLERIRRYRSRSDVSDWCTVLLELPQVIANDVAERLAPTAAP